MANLQQKYRLFKGLCGGDRAHTGPFYVTLDLTRRCNLRCFGCRFHSKEVGKPSPGDQDITDFPLEWAEKLFADVTALGTRQLFLLGDGEPFLHPHIFEIIRLAKKYGLHTTTTTNGTLLNETQVRQVIDSGLDNIHVSLWACSSESYEQHYPGSDPANFHRVIDGLRALSSLKAEKGVSTPRVTLLNPTSRLNYRDVDKMVVLAKEAGCDEVSFIPFKTNRGKMDRYALSAADQAELRRRVIALKKQIKAQGLSHDIERFLARLEFPKISHKLPCYVCWFHSRIKVDGTVVSCGRSTVPLGSLQTDRFADIWNGAAYREERIQRLLTESYRHREEITDCEVCGFVRDNRKIHRLFRPMSPFLPQLRRGTKRA